MLSPADLENLIGKDPSDAKVQKILGKVPGRVKREKLEGDVYYTYRDFGLILCETNRRFVTIFLKPKTPKNAEYGGELPEKLSFKMTSKEVIATLGEPDKNKGFQLLYDRGLYKLLVEFRDESMTKIVYSTL